MILRKIILLMEISRIYSLPMTIMSWLIVFTFALLDSGNAWYGILALFGICFVHLGANILDDYFDYKSLIKQVNFDKQEYIKNTQKTKCRYLVTGFVKEKEVLSAAVLYMFLASLIGLFFIMQFGLPVLYFMIAGGTIAVLYSFLSKIRLSELAIALAYGPILFGGVYYVMTKTLTNEVFIMAIPSMIMTVVLLYIHTVMDFEFDMNEGHKTVANNFDSQLDSLIILKILLILSYVSTVVICIFDISDWQILLSWLTIPLAVDLFQSMTDYSTDSKSVPKHKWYHFPMENMKAIEKMNAESFMMRMYQSRNLMIYFSLFIVFGLILAII